MPLDANIDLLLYSFKDNTRDIEGNTKELPKDISTGIYYVRDRFAENYPKEKDKDINSRGSYNVTVAIFDYEKNILYIYELDT